ncbi:MAG: ribosome biogenesis GTPase Der [Candidatus Buchananbacteria bacterium]
MTLLENKKLPTVVIVGRINVGKSSLFNRLTETHKALISEVEGTTRDYNLGQVAWRNKTFELIDTGGVDIEALKNSIQAILPTKKNKAFFQTNLIEAEIIQQTKTALKKADVILMVTDSQSGLMPQDKELALVLKKTNLPIMLVCNKTDNQKWQQQSGDFFKLGLGKPYLVSAANGSGTGDLLDDLIKKFKAKRGRPKKELIIKPIKVAIIGKPNVGKSSLVNKILGENRVIVSPIPQTTREPQDTEFFYQDKKIILIDTAGLRKKAKIEWGLEKMSTKRTLKMVKIADVILFVTEVDRALTVQDSYLGGLIKDSGAAMILVGNKWDALGDKDDKSDKQAKEFYQAHFPYLNFVPIIFVSAKTGKNVEKILDLIVEASEQRQKEVPEKDLKELMKKIVRYHHPAQAKGEKRPFLREITQTKVNPPEFTVTIGQDQSLHFSYLRFIENQIRYNFGFLATPIRIKVKTPKR